MDELLAIVGGSWQPLLVYPGILTGLVATGLMYALWHARARNRSRLLAHFAWDPSAALYAASAFLFLALLPFPRSYWAYPVDLVGALLLLELPHWLRLRRLLWAPEPQVRRGAACEAGALLNVYLLLALATAALGQASGSLLLPDLKTGIQKLRWAGLVTWAIAIPPLVALGPWYVPETDGWLPSLRRVAHIALLVALALPVGDRWGYGATAIGAAAGFGSLTILHFVWDGRPEPWERLQPLIAVALLGLLLFANAQAWLARLR